MTDVQDDLVKALRKGDRAINFALENTDGLMYSLQATLAVKPVVIVYYRGDW